MHERSLFHLETTGMRIDSDLARNHLVNAGAEMGANDIVHFPRNLVEECLRLAPKKFALGARRSGWDLEMNSGNCHLVADGEGTSIIDHRSGVLREVNLGDWVEATRLLDALDEFGVFWSMAEVGSGNNSIPSMVGFWISVFKNFSKHAQDAMKFASHAPWLLDILQTVFGDRETIRKTHPVSMLLCPQSPLMLDKQYTDAYLALAGWDVPVAIMPMPLMGATAPGSKIATITTTNCEVIGTLCLVQAAAPGTPVLYAPVPATMNPRTGFYSGGAIENAVMGAAAIEMGRYYGLPVEGSGGGTDHFIPGIQAGYEVALTAMMPMLSWPDLLVGPGLLGGSMILSFEQLLIEVEIFRMNRQAHKGISTHEEKWLDDVIRSVGPGGNYLGQPSTRDGIRSGAWLTNRLGIHIPQKNWEDAGKPTIQDEVREKINTILRTHQPLPLGDDVEKELAHIQKKANQFA